MTTAPASDHEIVDATAFARRLTDDEWLESPITDGTSPLTIVDLTTGRGADDDNDELAIPTSAPRVFVALGGESTHERDICDVALGDDGHAVAAIAEMAGTCRANPNASSVLVQLLRTAERGTVAQALWRESVTYSMLLAGPEFASWLERDQRRRGGWSARIGEHEPVTTELDGECFEVVLNRPHVHNAYNAAMRDALADALRAISPHPDRPPLRLRGRGPSFCSGGDLNEFGTTPDVVTAHLVRTARTPGLLLDRLGARATAVVHGACIGAGAELAAFCARVEAAPDARFCLPEVAMGLVPGAGGTVSVTRRVGRQRAALLALTGGTIDAHTALQWGLIDTVVP